ncbi:Bug family tripartite tricarboxylate transporter substrate binding protein [Variovorax sp. JS1663]|uniref:Bug family tripartite tricarboxylate transporter substrate binding protein n=1 Tax=Variovorax sp. JS1663 TaxID=1851577 RepID=UPI000B34180A|nr:tripartite tricarboxylate transporter substrate binding protein [Variovorax sp. JS1663]OUM00318.1 ABC transporter substrate-binding protein [Variovorax sp. JS1663]
MQQFACFFIACLAALMLPSAAYADSFPDKPVTLVVAFPPGGSSDVIARTLAAEMEEHLGQPMIVEYHPGAGGNIAAKFVARAPANGHTLLIGTSGPLATHAVLYRNLDYDPVKSFAPVIQVGQLPNLVMVHPSVPASDLKELVAYAQANPGKLSYASSGNGSASHLGGVLFSSKTGIDLLHVPYKGAAPALNDVLGGQISMSFTDVLAALPHVRVGKLKALGIASATRSSALPEVPTLAEQGLQGYEVSVFFGIVAPAGTPADRVKKLNRAFAEVLAVPKVKQQLAAQGLEPPPATTPDQLAKFIAAQMQLWAPVIRQSGAQID